MADPALLPGAHEVPAPHHVAVAALEAGGDNVESEHRSSAKALWPLDTPFPELLEYHDLRAHPQTSTTCRPER